MLNWKIIFITSITVIIVIICYKLHERGNLKQVFTNGSVIMNSDTDLGINLDTENDIKIKINKLLTFEEFKKISINPNMNLYYFHSDCPGYKEDILISTKNNGLDKFYVPERNFLILVKKDHQWTKEPKGEYFWKL